LRPFRAPHPPHPGAVLVGSGHFPGQGQRIRGRGPVDGAGPRGGGGKPTGSGAAGGSSCIGAASGKTPQISMKPFGPGGPRRRTRPLARFTRRESKPSGSFRGGRGHGLEGGDNSAKQGPPGTGADPTGENRGAVRGDRGQGGGVDRQNPSEEVQGRQRGLGRVTVQGMGRGQCGGGGTRCRSGEQRGWPSCSAGGGPWRRGAGAGEGHRLKVPGRLGRGGHGDLRPGGSR